MSTAGVSGGECRRIGSRRGEAARSPTRPRTAVVLGSGGVVGAAWMTGALHAVQQRLPVPVGDVNLIVGTSAGSVLAAALRCGVTLDEMTALQRGEPVPALRDAGLRDLDEGPHPPRPHLRAGSPRLMLTTLRAPRTIHPGVGASAWLPRGRGRHEALHATVAALDTFAGQRNGARGPADWSPGSWADGRTWIVAVDFDTGHRVMFGRAGAPRVAARRRRGRVLLHPGLVRAGRHRRPPLRGRRRALVHVAAVPGPGRPGRGLRPRAHGQPGARTGRPGPPSGWNAASGG